jgi:endonuclease G
MGNFSHVRNIFFYDDDQAVAGLKIPREFWKIVIWNEAGVLRATGILADQTNLLGDLSESIKPENLVQLPDKLPEEYHVRISHIQQLTNFDFGNIGDFDTFGEQEGLGDKIKIESFQDLFPKRNQ